MNPAYGLNSLHGAPASLSSRTEASNLVDHDESIWWPWVFFSGRLYQAGLHGAAASLSSRTKASNLVDHDESIWRPRFFFFFSFFPVAFTCSERKPVICGPDESKVSIMKGQWASSQRDSTTRRVIIAAS